MRRTGTLAFLTIVAMGSLSCGNSMGVETSAQSAMQDQSEIYKTFLTQWIGTEQKPINVSRTAETPSAADMKDFTECAASGTRWATPAPANDITGQRHYRPNQSAFLRAPNRSENMEAARPAEPYRSRPVRRVRS